MKLSCIIFPLLLLAAAGPMLHAQTDTILPNPNAVLLKRIWMVRGSSSGGDEVGSNAAGLSTLNADTIGDLGVYTRSRQQWAIYYGSLEPLSIVPAWLFDSCAGYAPVVGDFFGDGQQCIGFSRVDRRDLPIPYYYYRLLLYQARSLPLNRVPTKELRASKDDSLFATLPAQVLATDLDLDGDDELILVFGVFLREGVRSSIGEVWIYEGGPNFQVDSPTVILRDTERNGDDLRATIADFNGDRFPDILLTGSFALLQWTNKYKFFWGKPALQLLSEHPDHSLTLNDAAVDVGTLPTITDLDGDHIADIAGSKLPFTPLFLSSSGKPITQRTFRMDDADQILYTPNFYAAGQIGPLNDSTQQHPMLPLFGPSPLGGAMLVALSTNQQPINPTYEAFYGGAYDGLGPYNVFSNNNGPAGDVNGDGWCDYLTAQPKWPASDAGIAMILAGGPYIPRDDATTSVHDLPAEGKRDALAVWPNPVSEVLNIAWRGDLQRMPRRFVIHRINGERVAGGMVEPSVGAAIWHCETVASGSYLLTAYDAKNQMIATTTFIKQ